MTRTSWPRSPAAWARPWSASTWIPSPPTSTTPPAAGNPIPSATPAHLFGHPQANVVDLGYVVDLGAYSAPNPPDSPNLPRYFRDAMDRASHTHQHAPVSLRERPEPRPGKNR